MVDIKMLKNQDSMQKIGILPTVLIELYKVLVSSLLILFVPQKCGNHVCSINENFVSENTLYTSGLTINFITLFSFFVFYYIEVKRENKLIMYLEVNNKIASDNESVGKALLLLPNDKKNNIISIDKQYQIASSISLLLFLLNSIISGVVVYEYYLDNQTTSTFITNILFMTTKLGDIYSIANTEQNIFYSAYLKNKLQYNDVDPDKKITNFENMNNNECHIQDVEITTITNYDENEIEK
jgi:hypothetical protein